MPITNADGIVTPDEDDTDDVPVSLATMADSISSGIGTRLAAQELFSGAFINIAVPFSFRDYVTIPFKLYSGGTFVQNMTLNSDGSLKVITPGVYQVNLSIIGTVPDGYLEGRITLNGSSLGQDLAYPISGVPYLSVRPSAIFKCAANDVISGQVAKLFGSTSTTGSLDNNDSFPNFTTLTVAMVSASYTA